MTQDDGLMTDKELDALLAHASMPPLPAGARERVMERVAREAAAPNVIVFPRRAPVPQPARLGWLAGLPLAASLALGIYLGSGGTFGNVLPSTAYEILAGGSSDDSITGIEDIESYTEDDLS